MLSLVAKTRRRGGSEVLGESKPGSDDGVEGAASVGGSDREGDGLEGAASDGGLDD